MTTMHITHSRAEAPETADTNGPSVRREETPTISELVVVTLQLERLAETAGPPEDETAAHKNGITPEQQRSFVLGNARRIRDALDKITAPYETPTPSAPPDQQPQAGDAVTTAIAALHGTAALYAHLTGDRKGAQRIATGMDAVERAEFANQLDDLRKLLGTVCDNCGNLAEIGTSTTDPTSETCRFLCGGCAAELRRADVHRAKGPDLMSPPRRLFIGDERLAARQRAADLYRAGHTIRCVAAEIGRPWGTTRDLLTDADVVLRPRGARCTADH